MSGPLLTLDPVKLSQTLPLGTSWLLASCMEAKGKQDLWIQKAGSAARPARTGDYSERGIIEPDRGRDGIARAAASGGDWQGPAPRPLRRRAGRVPAGIGLDLLPHA